MKYFFLISLLFSATSNAELNYYWYDPGKLNQLKKCCKTQKQINKTISEINKGVAKLMAKKNPGANIGLIKANSQKIKTIQGKKINAKKWVVKGDIKPFDRYINLIEEESNED